MSTMQQNNRVTSFAIDREYDYIMYDTTDMIRAISRLLASYIASTKSYVLFTQPLIIHLMTMVTMRLMVSISRCKGIGEWRRQCMMQ